MLAAPAMNLRMWLHPAVARNVARLREDGWAFVGPEEGGMACGEYGPGRLAEPPVIADAVEALLAGETSIPLPSASPARTASRRSGACFSTYPRDTPRGGATTCCTG